MTPITRRLLSGLLSTMLLLALTLAGPPSYASSLGTMTAHDGLLRKGANTYTLDYAVTAPTGEWMMEIVVVDRRGKAVASPVLLSETFPDVGQVSFQLMRPGTRPGMFQVQTKLTWYDGWRTNPGTIDTVTFKLRKPHIKKKPRR
jgi:hypothetical protein